MAEKVKDIRAFSAEECQRRLADLRLSLMKSYTQVAQGSTPKNPGQIKAVKKTIARILTVLREKQGSASGKSTKEDGKKDGRN